jgi:hypothetical protein
VLSETKKIPKIQCIFQEISINIKKGETVIAIIVPKKIFEKSTCMKSIIEVLA